MSEKLNTQYYIVMIADEDGPFTQLPDTYKTIDEARIAVKMDKGYYETNEFGEVVFCDDPKFNVFRHIIFMSVEEM